MAFSHCHTKLLFFFFFFFFFTVLSEATISSSISSKEWGSATATYTKSPDASTFTGGACGYDDLDKSGYAKRTAAAVSGELFVRGQSCGGCFEVRCVDHILWCRLGSPSVVVTVTDFCAPNYGLPGDYGGWCNYPQEHFDMSVSAFAKIAVREADIVPVQYRRVDCERDGGMRFTITGISYFLQVLITNVGSDGIVVAVKVKGSRTGWIPMARNWGQNWHSNVQLIGQPLSFEVTNSAGRMVMSYNIAPSNWQFGQTFGGNQFEQ
ncbi:expansin-A16-like [Iris pallida]|uniref:Expansin n=1 Tax=Iris pallida TaxID=29817 RepID=A0AAX6DNB8_IRIPA|nr:expansin-A16-like [Iris pallida]